MTASEILRSAEPPPDDGLIEKAIADLDARIWEWADALKNAHSQLRGAFAARPPAPAAATQRPSAALFDVAPSSSLSAAAAAAHIPSPPPMPAEWTAPPSAPLSAEWAAAAAPPVKESPWSPSHGGHGASANAPAATATSHGVQLAEGPAAAGVMPWPSAPGSSSWPESGGGPAASSGGSQTWPTWTPTDISATASPTAQAKQAKQGLGGTPMRPGKAPKGPRPAVEGPSPEERAQKAAAEEALLAQLEEAVARRVRLLRRLDPDTAIEKLIDKAKQGQAETPAATSAKEDKSSWWRRK